MTDVNDKNIKDGTLKPIPMGYLRNGDRFVAEQKATKSSPRKIVTGVAMMDGNYVSGNYGFRANNMVQCAPEFEYINVHLDGVDYSNWASTPGRQVNTGLHANVGWCIYITPVIHARYLLDSAENKRIEAERAAEVAWRAEAAAADRKRATKRALLADLRFLEERVAHVRSMVAGMED